MPFHTIQQRLHRDRQANDPVGKRGACNLTTVALQNLLKPVQRQMSGAEESHLCALPKPDVTLSRHPAPIAQSFASQLSSAKTDVVCVNEFPLTSSMHVSCARKVF